MSKQKEIDMLQVRKLAEAGWSEHEIADFFKLTYGQWRNFVAEKPTLESSLEGWFAYSNKRVERTLYGKCLDHTRKEEKIIVNRKTGKINKRTIDKYVSGDLSAIEFWLTNKNPDEWKKRSEVKNEHSGGISVEASDLKARIALLKNEKIKDFFD